MGKLLLVAGAVLVVLGLVFVLATKGVIPRLPGDVSFGKGNTRVYIPLGTSLRPSYLTDVVHEGIAGRGIIEFTYKFPGQYLFHAHQTELSIKGWSGIFNVT